MYANQIASRYFVDTEDLSEWVLFVIGKEDVFCGHILRKWKDYAHIRYCIHQDEALQLQLLHMRDFGRNKNDFEITESEEGARCVLIRSLEPGNPHRITKTKAEELIYQPSREFRSSSHAAYVNKPSTLPKVVYCYNGTRSMEPFNVEWKLVGDDRQPFYQSTGKYGHVLYRDGR
eukprot:UN26128